MLLADPQPTPFDLRFRLFRTHVRIHPLFWLIAVMLGWGYTHLHRPATGNIVGDLALWVGCVFVSILVHEFGHALTGRLFGSHAHIVLYGFGGLGIFAAGWLGDRAFRRDVSGRLNVAWIGLAAAIPCLLLALDAPAGDLWRCAVWLLPGCMLLYAYYGTVYATIQDIVELGKMYGVDVKGIIRSRRTAENAIIQEIRGGSYDLLVMGVSPRPGDQLFFGEVPADLLARSPCSLVFLASEPAASAHTTAS